MWTWHSWQRGRFQYQRIRVGIQSSATFIEQLFTFTVCRKDENKYKEAEKAHLKKESYVIVIKS